MAITYRGTPSHVAMRYTNRERFMDELGSMKLAQARSMYASWEREWVEDGTLEAMGQKYVVIDPQGMPASQPMSFVDAFMTIYDPWLGQREDWNVASRGTHQTGYWIVTDEFTLEEEVWTHAKYNARYGQPDPDQAW